MTLVLALGVGQSMNPSLIKSIINTPKPKLVIGMYRTNVRRNIDVKITGCEFWASLWLFTGKLDTLVASLHQSSWRALGRKWRWSFIVTLSVMTIGIYGTAALVVLRRTWEMSTNSKHQSILFTTDTCDTCKTGGRKKNSPASSITRLSMKMFILMYKCKHYEQNASNQQNIYNRIKMLSWRFYWISKIKSWNWKCFMTIVYILRSGLYV